MTKEEAKRILCIFRDVILIDARHIEAFDMAIKALEQEPCDDAISRQSAILLASDLKQDLPDDERISDMVMAHNEGILEYQTQLSLLPLVQPKPKTGHWIKSKDGYMRCDLCGSRGSAIKARFCHHCGAKMESEDKE